jgi:hypothetical protein
MTLEAQVVVCSQHYQKWKNLAIAAKDMQEAQRCLDKAFFWLELQTAFITLFAAEKANEKNPEVEKKIFEAKANLTKKLANYCDQTLKELDL